MPPCPNCGGILKPDVVFFGDGVPAERSKRYVPLLCLAQASCHNSAAHLLFYVGMVLTCTLWTSWLLNDLKCAICLVRRHCACAAKGFDHKSDPHLAAAFCMLLICC